MSSTIPAAINGIEKTKPPCARSHPEKTLSLQQLKSDQRARDPALKNKSIRADQFICDSIGAMARKHHGLKRGLT
ncbi:MAG: hypothetical protein LBV36_04745 [Chromatiales bacterium]|jgi:hypothetical protein|nr:hypothetical protein [Chromatiales bacterium]